MKDNKLIAEFMGGIKSSVPNLINLPQTIGQSSILCVKGSEGLPSSTYKVERINELQYHSSWDWLMPVIIKMADIREDTHYKIYKTIDEAYEEVVEFIKLYNMKDNKLIAEFMGVNVITLDDVRKNKDPYHSSSDGYLKDDLKYHSSWDWLMPVVEVCLIGEAEQSEEISNTTIKNIYEGICNQDISFAYKSVVEFINYKTI